MGLFNACLGRNDLLPPAGLPCLMLFLGGLLLSLAGTDCFSCSLMLAGADRFSCSLMLAGANRFSCSLMLAGADRFSCSLMLAGADRFSRSLMLAGADRFSCSLMLAGADRFSRSLKLAWVSARFALHFFKVVAASTPQCRSIPLRSISLTGFAL